MCVAIPGEVIRIEEGSALVDFGGNKIHALTGLTPVRRGDYVLVHAGCIIQTMKKNEADELAALMKVLSDEIDD